MSNPRSLAGNGKPVSLGDAVKDLYNEKQRKERQAKEDLENLRRFHAEQHELFKQKLFNKLSEIHDTEIEERGKLVTKQFKSDEKLATISFTSFDPIATRLLLSFKLLWVTGTMRYSDDTPEMPYANWSLFVESPANYMNQSWRRSCSNIDSVDEFFQEIAKYIVSVL